MRDLFPLISVTPRNNTFTTTAIVDSPNYVQTTSLKIQGSQPIFSKILGNQPVSSLTLTWQSTKENEEFGEFFCTALEDFEKTSGNDPELLSQIKEVKKQVIIAAEAHKNLQNCSKRLSDVRATLIKEKPECSDQIKSVTSLLEKVQGLNLPKMLTNGAVDGYSESSRKLVDDAKAFLAVYSPEQAAAPAKAPQGEPTPKEVEPVKENDIQAAKAAISAEQAANSAEQAAEEAAAEQVGLCEAEPVKENDIQAAKTENSAEAQKTVELPAPDENQKTVS